MVVGTLRGFDQFMNLVVDNTVEVNGNEKTDIGMVVSLFRSPGGGWINLYDFQHHDGQSKLCFCLLLLQVIRGNSVVTVEALEPVARAQWLYMLPYHICSGSSWKECCGCSDFKYCDTFVCCPNSVSYFIRWFLFNEFYVLMEVNDIVDFSRSRVAVVRLTYTPFRKMNA